MTPQPHTEVEVKYDVTAELTLPDLLTVEGVAALEEPPAMHLDATYFDTVDLRLLQTGTTLRRRTGGVDEGWHLKLPKVDDARIEIHQPLGTGETVPEVLQQLTRAQVRDRTVAPVATLRTRRVMTRLLDPAGAVLAEVCDDSVTGLAHGPATRTQWRELEVELVDGDRALLAAVGARLVEAGAAPATAASKLARVLPPVTAATAGRRHRAMSAGEALTGLLRTQTELLVACDPPLRIDTPGAVHTMRTAVRALRGTLSTYRPLLQAESTEPIRAELAWFGGLLAAVRDAEVVAARLKSALADEPPELITGPVLQRVSDATGDARARACLAVLDAVDTERYLRALDSLDELCAAPPLRAAPARRPAAAVHRRLIRRSWRRVLDRAATADATAGQPEQAELLHDVRRSVRRARNALAAAPAAPAALTRRLTQLQDALGVCQDTELTRRSVRVMAVAAARAGEDTFSYGRLHAREQAVGAAAAAEYGELLATLRSTTSRWLGGKP